MWHLKHPPAKLEELAAIKEDQRVEIPVEDQPETAADTDYMLVMWRLLSAHRPPSFGTTAPLTLSEIVRVFYEWDVYEFCTRDVFVDWIESIDDTARNYWREEQAERDKELEREREQKRRQR